MMVSKTWEESFELMKPWREAFNSSPDEVRKVGCAMDIQTRLQHLHFERQRLKEAYDSSLRKIREHEVNLLSDLRRMGSP